MNEETFKFFDDHKLIAVVRTSQAEDVEPIIEALRQGGIRMIQIGQNVPHVYRVIEALSKESGVVAGIANVLNGEDAQRAINSGAKFISSPFTSTEVINLAKYSEILVMPGISTPTEAVEANQLGATLVNVCPADLVGGPRFVKWIRSTIPSIKTVPYGRVNLENVLEYIKSGATAVCLENGIIEKSWVRAHDWAAITERAKQLVAQVESLKVAK